MGKNGRLFGYARVSTDDQSCALQIEQLKTWGVPGANIFSENVSGGSRAGRVQLDAVLEKLQCGDTLVVTKIDRFGRRVIDVLEMVEELTDRGVRFCSIDLAIDTSKPTGKFFLTLMAAFAEMERARIRERQREGIDRAMALDQDLPLAERKYKGRAPTFHLHAPAVHSFHAAGIPKRQIAFMLGISRSTVYKCLAMEA